MTLHRELLHDQRVQKCIKELKKLRISFKTSALIGI